MTRFSDVLKAAALGLAVFLSAHGSPFTPGNLAVYRTGDGSRTLVNTGNPIFIDEFTTNGTLVQSIAMPSVQSGSHFPMAASGTASSEGGMTLAANRAFLVVPGYGTNIHSASLTGTSGTAVPRIVGMVDAAGTVDTTTALTDWSTGNNPRGVCSSDGTNIWVTGGAGGPRYAVKGGTTSVQISTTLANNRFIQIFGGQLYSSDSSGTSLRLATIGTGLPITSGQTMANLPGFATSGSPYGFYFADLTGSVAGLDTLYVADDAAGIQKWCLVGGNWTLLGTVGTGTDAYRGLTGVASGSEVWLYATRKGGTGTTGGGELVSLNDTAGYNANFSSSSITLLATAGNQTAFRGVAFAPVPSAAPAAVIGVSGYLHFGNVTTGTTANAALTITNAGSLVLNITNILYPPAFSGAWTGIVSPGSASNVTVTFAPDAVQSYGGTISVQSDAASGSGQINCSGTGVVASAALTVAITSPTNGQLTGSNIFIAVTATSAGTITNVELFADGNPVGTDTTAPYEFTWTSAPTGQHSLAAIASDDLGASATSTVINITVTNAGPATYPPSINGSTSGVAIAVLPLTGGVNPGGLPTEVFFEYGPTIAYGNRTASALIPGGYGISNVTLLATGLLAGVLHHYRPVASNNLGTANGTDRTFIAGAPADNNGDGIISQPELDTVLAAYWPSAVPNITNFVHNGGGRFTVQMPSPGLWGFTVQSTTDFIGWTNVTQAGPAWQFTDPIFPSQTNRTYRLVTP
jgi:hypothetical protein